MPDTEELVKPLFVDNGEMPCFDSECLDDNGERSIATVERDGEHMYYECDTCGSCFNYTKLAVDHEHTDTCAVGIPEDLRRRMSAGMEGAMAADARSQPIPIALGRKPE
jgi:hypothetical protein